MRDWLVGIVGQLTALVVGLIVLIVVLSILKGRRPNEKEAKLLPLANTITEDVLAAILVGALIFVTFRYS
jgi:hypothetical protein